MLVYSCRCIYVCMYICVYSAGVVYTDCTLQQFRNSIINIDKINLLSFFFIVYSFIDKEALEIYISTMFNHYKQTFIAFDLFYQSFQIFVLCSPL